MKRLALPLIALLIALPNAAQGVVDENFDSYADTAALEAVWSPDTGDGDTPSVNEIGILIPALPADNFPAPYDNPPGLVGNAIGNNNRTGVNEYNGSAFDLEPSETQNVVLRGDVYVDGVIPNQRQFIGLRNDTIDRQPGFGEVFGLNVFEMGIFNAATCDPTVDGCVPSTAPRPTGFEEGDVGFIDDTQFAYRLVLFDSSSFGDVIENGVNKGPLLATPNYQYFPLDPALDLEENGGNADGVTDIADIGEGFHTYQATFSLDTITLELDLFANDTNEITGLSEPDSIVEIGIALTTNPEDGSDVAGFTSLRVGGPSGVSSNAPAVFDNIYLALEDIDSAPGIPGDFDGDGDVDGADFGVFVGEFQTGDTGGPGADAPFSQADLNESGFVDGADFGIFVDSFQNFPPTPAAVPEPSSAVVLLTAMGLAGFASRGR